MANWQPRKPFAITDAAIGYPVHTVRGLKRADGNVYSKPANLTITKAGKYTIALTETIPPIPPPKDTKYIKHITVESERVTKVAADGCGEQDRTVPPTPMRPNAAAIFAAHAPARAMVLSHIGTRRGYHSRNANRPGWVGVIS